MIGLGRFAALTFDCYGTLIDWEAGILRQLRAWARRHGIGAGDDALLAAYGEAETRFEAVRPALPYPQVLRCVHANLARRFAVAPDEAAGIAFAASVGDWPAFADTPKALRYLQRFYWIAIVSNVDRRSFAATLPKLGIVPDFVVTADDVGAYKPDRPHFERVLALLAEWGVAKAQVLHVAQSAYHDIEPARSLGLATLWVDRRRGRPGRGTIAATVAAPAPAPDLRVTSLAGLVRLHRRQTRAG